VTRKVYPEQWATQNNLGNAYLERIRGERAENLEQAIFHYQQALEVRTPGQAYNRPTLSAFGGAGIWSERFSTSSRRWNNLGNAYLETAFGASGRRIWSRRFSTTSRRWKCIPARPTRKIGPGRKTTWAKPTETAFGASGRRIWSRRFSTTSRHWKCIPARPTRQQWAATQNNLGNAYAERIRGERAENLEQAIFHYQQALEVYTRQAYPQQWAATQNNLATAYAERIRGERAENLEQAIFHYQQALEVRTRQAYPEDWAMTQNNLGTPT
jgi:tetratricopeptide (TPR) repeat protein